MIKFFKNLLGIGEKPDPYASLPRDAIVAHRGELVRSVPELPPVVERVTDRRFGCLLQWELSEGQQQAPRHGWFPKLFYRMRGRRHRLVLDDMGRQTVELIDGSRSIRQIARELCTRNNYADQTKMEDAVLAFMTLLARRNAVLLKKS